MLSRDLMNTITLLNEMKRSYTNDKYPDNYFEQSHQSERISLKDTDVIKVKNISDFTRMLMAPQMRQLIG